MERKQWLETFLRLADSNSPTIDYRRHLRLKSRDLPPHVANIPKYRAELAAIKAEEAKAVAEAAELARKMDEQRKRREEQAARRAAAAEAEDFARRSRTPSDQDLLGGDDLSESGPDTDSEER